MIYSKKIFLIPSVLILLSGIFNLHLLQAQQVDWAHQIGNLDTNNPERLHIDADGNVYGIGNFTDSLDFDPGPLVAGIRSNGSNDVYMKKSSPTGALLWVKRIGGTGNDKRSGSALDAAGNLYLAINCSGIIDLDPGSGVYNSEGLGDALLKLDKNGDFVWALNFVDLNEGLGLSNIVVSESNAIYIGGAFQGHKDFDPGPGTFNMNTQFGITWTDAFLMKLDASGAFQWAKKWGDSDLDYTAAIALDHQGNILANGLFKYEVDFDPGPGETILDVDQECTIFVSKFDTSGNFIWVKSLKSEFPSGFSLDANDNILIGGVLLGTNDMDPGPGVFNLTPPSGYRDIFIVKLDADGNFLWAKNMGGNSDDYIKSIDTDELGNVYSTGSFGGSADFDPGPDSLLFVGNTHSTFILKSDFLGNTLWAKRIMGKSVGSFIKVAPNGSIYTSGGFEADVTLNPGDTPSYNFISIGGFDTYLMKINQGPHYNGTVFNDLNVNGVRDANEPGLRGFLASAPITDKYATTNTIGEFHFYDNILGDTVRITPPYPGWTVQPAFAIPSSTQSPMNFAASGPPATDIRVAAVETTPFRPGFGSTIMIQVTNFGSIQVNDLDLAMKIQVPAALGLLQLSGVNLDPSSQTDNEINWLIPQIAPSQTVLITAIMSVSSALENGNLVEISFSAPVVSDVFPDNNTAYIRTISVGSFDPNDKQVTPDKVAPEALDSTTLKYVIRFQNTGTYKADFVVIRDTLPMELDLATLNILASSHPFSWRLFGPRVLEFRFDPINLPDSTSNEPESHGFIAFTVKAKMGLPEGTSILNRAGIYFDYNKPIITNTSVVQVVSVVKATEPGKENWIDFALSPNPVAAYSKVTVSLPEFMDSELLLRVNDVHGREIQSIRADKGVGQVNLNGLHAGVYYVQACAGTGCTGKLLIVE